MIDVSEPAQLICIKEEEGFATNAIKAPLLTHDLERGKAG